VFALLILTLVFAIAVPFVVVTIVMPNTARVVSPVRVHRVDCALIALASSNHLPRPPRA
jgi:hypothetical protein